jgi:hypothetical protein
MDPVPGALVVVCRGAVVGADFDRATRKSYHPSGGSYSLTRKIVPQGGRVWPAFLELEGLEDRLIVLVLVLEHHLVYVAVPNQGAGLIEISDCQTAQDPDPNFVHDFAAVRQGGKRQRSPLTARVLERIEQSGHLDKLYRALEVTGEPELLEVGDMPQVP